MKTALTYVLSGYLALFIFSCASYQAKKQEALLAIPDLGTVVKVKGSMLYEASKQVGIPDWEVLPVHLQEMPFNRSSYATYAKSVFRSGKINNVPYQDSLPYKPKYLRVQLLDKISLAQLFNGENGKALRDYLQTDKDHKLVTSLDLALSETDITFFLQAQALQLQKDEFGTIQLVVFNGNTEQRYYFSELEVFDYGYSSFCWGEDQFGNLKIANITPEGEKCPRGTFMKATKARAEKEYLKL